MALLVAATALAPVEFVMAAIITSKNEIGRLVFRWRTAELLLNSLALVGLTVPICAAVALVLAWLTERTDLPAGRLWAWLVTAPLAIPAFVQGYAWSSLAPDLQSLAAATVLSTLAYLPLLYLPVAATLRRLDSALEDSAAALGDSPWRVFRRVVLPQLRLAIAGGALLVGLHLLGEYGLFAMIRFDTFTTAIVDQFKSTFDGPAANMMAGVLLACCLVLVGLDALGRGTTRYARTGAGAPRPATRVRLGGATIPAVIACGALALASVGVPILTLGRWLVLGGAEIWRFDEIGPALAQTMLWSLFGGLFAVAAAWPVAWISARAAGPFSRSVGRCCMMVGSLPGVVVALGLVTITIRLFPPLYQTAAILILAYAIMFLPRALVSVRAGVAQAPVTFEEVAGSLARSPLKAIVATTLPLAAPGAGTGFVLVSLGIASELTVTQMLAPNGTRTLATSLWSLGGELDYAAAAPYGLLMILVSLPLVLLLHSQLGRTSR